MSAEQPPVRFGFLGAGRIAHRALGPAVHAARGAQLQAVAARDAARGQTLQPAGQVYTDYAELLADPAVEAVYISLTNDNHRPWTLAALAAGKHVLCEKPLGLDRAEVVEMVDAAVAADRLLVEAFWYRWHPRTRRLEQLVTSGALGPIVGLETEFSYRGPDDTPGEFRLDPKLGGGGLYDVGCYAISGAHLALGADLSVGPVRATFGPTGVDVDAAVGLTSSTGAHGTARCGIAVRDRQAFSVTGQAARVDFTTGEAFSNRGTPSALTITTPDGAVRVEEFAPVDPYTVMVEAMSARIRGRDAFLVDAAHSLQIAATLDAALAAARAAD